MFGAGLGFPFTRELASSADFLQRLDLQLPPSSAGILEGKLVDLPSSFQKHKLKIRISFKARESFTVTSMRGGSLVLGGVFSQQVDEKERFLFLLLKFSKHLNPKSFSSHSYL